MNVADIVDWRARKYGGKPAIKHKGRALSFADVKDLAGRCIAGNRPL